MGGDVNKDGKITSQVKEGEQIRQSEVDTQPSGQRSVRRKDILCFLIIFSALAFGVRYIVWKLVRGPFHKPPRCKSCGSL